MYLHSKAQSEDVLTCRLLVHIPSSGLGRHQWQSCSQKCYRCWKHLCRETEATPSPSRPCSNPFSFPQIISSLSWKSPVSSDEQHTQRKRLFEFKSNSTLTWPSQSGASCRTEKQQCKSVSDAPHQSCGISRPLDRTTGIFWACNKILKYNNSE